LPSKWLKNNQQFFLKHPVCVEVGGEAVEEGLDFSFSFDAVLVGFEEEFDAGFDAGYDTGFGAGFDAGFDPGFDAGLAVFFSLG
jgi:hypothetical protein